MKHNDASYPNGPQRVEDIPKKVEKMISMKNSKITFKGSGRFDVIYEQICSAETYYI